MDKYILPDFRMVVVKTPFDSEAFSCDGMAHGELKKRLSAMTRRCLISLPHNDLSYAMICLIICLSYIGSGKR
eukprot:scaffold627757_cov24-Prasinocladus_malaysianus.AAC.1